MANQSQHNDTAVIEHNKRVSFGGEEHVQMILYDDGVENDYSIASYRQQNKSTTYTDPDAPLSRVRVHAEQVELPRPISPPAQITTTTTQPTAIVDAVGSSASGLATPQVTASSTSIQMVNSPPLPSFMKKSEHENENPFRPDEQLYHEVDPIVELYRQKPFPPSPSHGSPVPSHQLNSQPSSSSYQRSSIRTDKVANGDSGGGGGA
nr:unnamed protein product [Meloidogyne enterolobii]CAD2187754.1 unnamed protein product [Meloidogyne enterolobii]